MLKKEIFGENRAEKPLKERIGSRGIVIKDNKILLVHELKGDLYMIPGGGVKAGETPCEACVRELKEETGYIVFPDTPEPVLELIEYYGDNKFVGCYFKCSIAGEALPELTAAEKENKMVAQWVLLADAFDIFSHHEEFRNIRKEKSGAYLREYTALCAVLGNKEIL